MPSIISKSPEETLRIGADWAQAARSGWVVGLSGDLGAGKTQLVKGIARGLGTSQRVHSPTFNLVNQYDGGRLRLFHLDLYRLQSSEEAVSAGLEEFLPPADGIAVVEWIERWLHAPPAPPFPFRQVRIDWAGDLDRRISYEDFGT